MWCAQRGWGEWASKAHPFPVTVSFLADGIKRLRAVSAQRADAQEKMDFWRGMKNLEAGAGFMEQGGTEFAPMSTSSDFHVALRYSSGAETRLLFKILTNGFMERGASLQFLSAFPGEREFLYAPLTFLQPTGAKEIIEMNGCKITVLEVKPLLS